MKERGSDREKGSAKSCQPEIKQAGTLPIPKPLHPPQSHILPLHSLYLSPLPPCFHLPSLYSTFHCKWIYLNPGSTLVLLCDFGFDTVIPASLLAPHIIPIPVSLRVSVWCSFSPLRGHTVPLFVAP